MAYPPLPGFAERIEGSIPWRTWFESLNRLVESGQLSATDAIAAIATKLGSPDGTVENIPPISSGGVINASDSIEGVGQLPGAVELRLINDTSLPGSSKFYGTSSAGLKGWQDFAEAVDDRVASLITAGANITIVYDDVTNTLTISTAATQTNFTRIDAVGDIRITADGDIRTCS